jgi:pyruvate formate lyase activating enzyme
MSYYKVTYNAHFKRANLHGWGCNFNCRGCSYRVKTPYHGEPPLSVEKVKEVLRGLDIERVHFLGGEPTINPDLPEVAGFVHDELGLYTKIGHSNGSRFPPEGVDATSVSIKAYTDSLHRDYTGVSNVDVLKNFEEAYGRGIAVDASSVFIPGYVDCDEIEKIASFITRIDAEIPYHIIGYIPQPDAPWRQPTRQEVEKAAAIARKHLSKVTCSCLSNEEVLHPEARDIRYRSVRVA